MFLPEMGSFFTLPIFFKAEKYGTGLRKFLPIKILTQHIFIGSKINKKIDGITIFICKAL